MEIIIGATNDIGETTTRLFVVLDAQILIAYMQDTHNLVEELGNGFEFIFYDVKKEDEVTTVVEKGVSMGEGRVD